MTLHTSLGSNSNQSMDALARAAAAMGYEIVDIAGFLDLVEQHAKNQRSALVALDKSASDIKRSNATVNDVMAQLSATSEQALSDVQSTVALVRSVSETSRDVAEWVQSVEERTSQIKKTLVAVNENNTQIAGIATQVNTLAINAKIEAARAGDAGRGFAIVADAINDLSQETRIAAKQITDNVAALSGWIRELGEEAGHVAHDASTVLEQTAESDAALGRMEATIQTEHEQTQKIATSARDADQAMAELHPAVAEIDQTVTETASGIQQTHTRVHRLIDASERIVQLVGGLGGPSADGPFITKVQHTAAAISDAMEAALAKGQITRAALFDTRYRPIAGSDPQQVVNEATSFLDRLLPAFQEPVLEFDRKVVFCAAVDVNGYLPTHNRKFSKPQGDDPVWNMANCRNRRIFDDRVGLKAGRNTRPFLLQVYRRDMGGGDFRVMKDLSAPIRVGGRHWGGLRLAYGYQPL